MIKVENIEVWGFEAAVRGMRNPLNSWDKSDSIKMNNTFIVGNKDLKLAKKLYRSGTEHRKYLRQIFVSMDITSNHTFWAEFDTYKVGTVRNSCSKMHKIHAKPFEADDFTHENIDKVDFVKEEFWRVLETLEGCRIELNRTGDKTYWRAMIDLLPMGCNLKATVTMNYENVVNIINQRSEHKLDEWREFCEILRGLPYAREIIKK